MEILGRFNVERKVNIKGIAHITGGGIPGNFKRILKQTELGARFDNLFKPSDIVKEIQEMGEVTEEEAYRTWNMGNGMMLVAAPGDIEKIFELLSIEAQVVGEIIEEKKIILKSKGLYQKTIIYNR